MRSTLSEKLTKAGFASIPELTVTHQPIRYLMRRGRARVKPLVSQAQNRSLAEKYAEAREGLFGLPLKGETDLKLVYLEDASSLVKTRAPVPDCLEDELLRFDDLIRMAVESDLETRINAQTAPLHYKWAGFDTHTAWHPDVYLLDIPVVTFDFEYHDTKDTLKKTWSNTRADGRYTVAFNGHDGAVLRSEVPSRGTNVTTVLVGLFAVMFGLPAVGSVLMALIPILFTLCMGILGVLVELVNQM